MMTKNHFVKIKALETNEVIEFPLEWDYSLSHEILISQFPNATGLKFINKKNSQVRTVRKYDEKFFIPHDLRLDDLIFFCTYSLFKKPMVEEEESSIKSRETETIESIHSKYPVTFDLLAIGLSYDTSEENLYDYLKRFGELFYCMLKTDEISGESQGMAYFRFKKVYSQSRCLSTFHLIDKTKIIIKIPKEKIMIKDEYAFKLFLHHISPNITREDIRAYFSQFGVVVNLFMPHDKRSFAFITFCDQSAVERTIAAGPNHIFNGGRVSVNTIVKRQLNNFTQLTVNEASLPIKDNTLKRVSTNGNEAAVTTEKYMRTEVTTETQNVYRPCASIEGKIPPELPQQNHIGYQVNASYAVPSEGLYHPNIVPYPSTTFTDQLQPAPYQGNTLGPISQGYCVPYPPPISFPPPTIEYPSTAIPCSSATISFPSEVLSNLPPTISYQPQTVYYPSATDAYQAQTISYLAQTNPYLAQAVSYQAATDFYPAQLNSYPAQTVHYPSGSHSYPVQMASYQQQTLSFPSPTVSYLSPGAYTAVPMVETPHQGHPCSSSNSLQSLQNSIPSSAKATGIKSQLQNLVTQFIQEIKDNLSSLSNE